MGIESCGGLSSSSQMGITTMTHAKPVHTNRATVGGGQTLSLARQRELAEEEDMSPAELRAKREREKKFRLHVSRRPEYVANICQHSPDPGSRTSGERLKDGR